jgi:hypothetical protein
MRRIDRLLTELRQRRLARAARVQGLIEPPVDFDPIQEFLALYGLVHELRGLSDSPGALRVLDSDRLDRVKGRVALEGIQSLRSNEDMNKRLEDMLTRQSTKQGRFANAKYSEAIQTAIADATIYANVFTLFDLMFELLDDWDTRRKITPQQVSRLKSSRKSAETLTAEQQDLPSAVRSIR